MNSFVEILHSENDDNRSVKFKIKNIDKLGVSDSFDPINEAIEFEKYLNMERLFLEETIIMLMVKFEDAISNLLHCLFERYPDKYLADKTISYSEIVKYNSSELESYIITNLIDKTMRKDYTEWFKIFQNHGISIEKYGIYDDFIELYCRRNIIVHNKSIVNSSYLNGISKTKISKPELDSHLLVDENYVLKAFNTIECIILSIFLECGRFFKNSDKNKYLDEVFNVGFDFLCREQYDVSEFIFEQLEKLDVENITKMMSKVNRWISQKAKYGIDSVKNEIEKTDFSALMIASF